jgi:hypothetical protein
MLYAMRGRADESPREFLRGLIDDDGRNSISVSIATIMDRAQKGLPLPFRDQWAPPEGRETPLP